MNQEPQQFLFGREKKKKKKKNGSSRTVMLRTFIAPRDLLGLHLFLFLFWIFIGYLGCFSLIFGRFLRILKDLTGFPRQEHQRSANS